MASLVVDIFEPESIAQALSTEFSVVRTQLEPLGLADYYWETPYGRETIERKRWNELLGDRLEAQLRRYLSQGVNTTLLLEGVCTASPSGSIVLWKASGRFLVAIREIERPYIALANFLWRLQDYGVRIVLSPDISYTPRVIAGLVKNSLKAEHKTLSPYRRTKQVDDPNPYIALLAQMGIPGLGPKNAQKLIATFGTPWSALSAPPEQLAKTIGKALTNRILTALGRDDQIQTRPQRPLGASETPQGV